MLAYKNYNYYRNRILVGLFAFLGFQCSAPKPYYNPQNENWQEEKIPSEQPKKTVFLLGDAGKPATDPLEPTFKLLQKHLANANEESTLLFLGDNLYPLGLPDSADATRAEAEKYLKTQLDLAKNFKGKSLMIPGNHDWAQGKEFGLKNRMNQEKFVEDYLENEDVFFPKDGCPGPVEVNLSDDLVLLMMDTQWWLHAYNKPDETSDCEATTDGTFLLMLHEAILRNRDKKIIVAAHHPMYSNSLHGGHTPFKNHLFPLTNFADGAYLPLPGLGSIYVFYRTILGNIQDIPHPRYKQMRDALVSVFKQHPNLMYVNGHDHALQYHLKDKIHYITSGAGAKETYVARKAKAEFAYAKKGFGRIDFFDNGEAWLSFYVPKADGSEGELIFRQKLFADEPEPESAQAGKAGADFEGKVAKAAAVEHLEAKGLKKWILGGNYRNEWRQSIDKIPYFDIEKEKGGLEVVQKGGGMQTRSLRLEAKGEQQYVLRSIQKFPEKAVPEALRNTIAAEIVEDQISASHPYAAFVVPQLADAVGVYHTNPELVYVPKDPRMGIYAVDFKEGLYLYEERPAKNRRDVDSFGNSKKIDNTAKVLKKTLGDNDYMIDSKQVLRSRLFDMWLGDWDRHDDQWRWARFKNKKEDTYFYSPIPRDRDQAFFESDGLLLKIGSRKWGQRKMQGFREEIRDPAGLGFNARYFDRSFLTEPDWKDWDKMVGTFKEKLTDDVIETSIKSFPPEIYQHSGEDITRKLKARRDKLEKYARIFYESLAKEVNVLGTDKHEYFKIERLDDEKTRVRVYKMKKKSREKKHKIYDRTFLSNETKEIRLYGLAGSDWFDISGDVKKGIKIRVIGGDGDDLIEDKSKVSGVGKKTKVYDDKKGNELNLGKEAKDLTSSKPAVNNYNRKAFEYNLVAPQISFNINPDDALFLGGGVLIKTHGFRKNPFKTQHSIIGNFAPKTTSFSFEYLGEFNKILGNWDFVLETDVRYPNFVDFFYGFGNATKNEVEERGNQYNRVRYEQILFKPSFRTTSKNLKHQFSIGYYLQLIGLEDGADTTRFVYQPESGLNQSNINNTKFFDGFFTQYTFDSRNDKTIPTEGIYFNSSIARITGNDEENREEISFTQLKADLSLFLSLGKYGRAVFATRVGTAANLGKYAFFQANTLGGQQNLRGFRRMRFAGDQSAYWNNELRLKLFNIQTYLFPAKVGITGIYDVGRVWYNDEREGAVNETSTKWHKGYGAGVWFTPFQATVVHFDLTASDDQNKLLRFVRFGFFF